VTYTIEGLMQDGKALQMGTSHDLGQNFAKAFDIKFSGRTQQQEYAWTTSWGMTTRMIGATIMVHSDDEGLVLPPRVAADVAAIVPIYKSPEDEAKVRGFLDKLIPALVGRADVNKVARHGLERYLFDPFNEQRIVADFRDARPGDKQYHWEQRGVPFRLEVGPRDVDAGAFVLKSRVDGSKHTIKLDEVTPGWLRGKLDAAHDALLQRARKFRDDNTRRASSYDELKQILKEHGGLIRAFFKPGREQEARIKEETKATVRCIPFDQPGTSGKCIYTGEETSTEVLFAQAY
jgi:prolyl-tRNA synthetase